MAFDDFRCVVVGNEPAGLWLLAQLEKAYREVGEEPRLAWVRLGEEPPPVCLPSLLGGAFGVGPSASWSAELLTPRTSYSWTAKTLADKFPELAAVDSTRDPLDSLLKPSAQDMASVRTAIARKPELIGLAQGLWKALGRTERQTPESVVHYARYFTALQWWSPEKDLSPAITRLTLDPFTNPLQSFKARRTEGLALTFQDGTEIVGEHWILNHDVRTLTTLAGPCKPFLHLANLHLEPASLKALYPLRLRVESDAIPAPVAPLTLSFDTDLIPDPHTEIWPMTVRPADALRDLTVWTAAPGLVSLEAALDALREGMQRAQNLFPFLAQRLKQVSVPLGMESCFDEAQRRTTSDELQASSVEHYTQTGFYAQTRSSALSLLMPHMGCHLPYPVGALVCARQTLAGLAPKKKKAAPKGAGLDGQPNAG